jgi:phosphoribosylaminoimidazolecarboxamide formyltransferase/IMP cyclohydrolase
LVAQSNYIPADYRHYDRVPIRRALISVSDKTGLIELAKALYDAGVELVSTGSTAKTIKDAGIKVIEVSEVTGFDEALDGRVKTLHPAIHGGLLADMRLIAHEDQLAGLGYQPFQLAVVNLYPFVETVQSDATADQVIEQIDIGGPAMVRAAAKNHANVAIVVDPSRYGEIFAALDAGGTTLAQRRELALAAFSHTAKYDAAVANWFAEEQEAQWRSLAGQTTDESSKNPGFAADFAVRGELATVLRYGENAHQAAALYRTKGEAGIAQARLLNGKEMSYNNYVDADAALRAAYDFTEPAVAIIKHANPCGIAIGDPTAQDPIANAHARAHLCDPLSAFGGVIASNRPVTLEFAKQVTSNFTEVIIAPGFAIDALQELLKKPNLRVLQLPANYQRGNLEFRQVSGGLLVQQPDVFSSFSTKAWKLVSGVKPDHATLEDLKFAWRACRSVKSNAILLASDGATIGIGMGQVNRVDSSKLAVDRGGPRVRGSVAASDAFFPFADGLQILLDAGVTAVVQPGGSKNDAEVIAAAEAAGATMYFTGERHFFH